MATKLAPLSRVHALPPVATPIANLSSSLRPLKPRRGPAVDAITLPTKGRGRAPLTPSPLSTEVDEPPADVFAPVLVSATWTEYTGKLGMDLVACLPLQARAENVMVEDMASCCPSTVAVGDRISRINDVDVRGMSLRDVLNVLQSVTYPLTITFRRPPARNRQPVLDVAAALKKSRRRLRSAPPVSPEPVARAALPSSPLLTPAAVAKTPGSKVATPTLDLPRTPESLNPRAWLRPDPRFSPVISPSSVSARGKGHDPI